jgi:hypothetical protein
MSPSERDSFEEEMKRNPGLAAEVSRQKEIMKHLNAAVNYKEIRLT